MPKVVPLNEPSHSPHPPSVKRDVVYLACPYTDIKPSVREMRFKAATNAAASLIQAGRVVYSPITMTHPIDIVLAGAANTLGSDYWVAFDEAFMEMCSEIVVLLLEGWDRSAGVAREIEYFLSRGRPVSYMRPDSSASRMSPGPNFK